MIPYGDNWLFSELENLALGQHRLAPPFTVAVTRGRRVVADQVEGERLGSRTVQERGARRIQPHVLRIARQFRAAAEHAGVGDAEAGRIHLFAMPLRST